MVAREGGRERMGVEWVVWILLVMKAPGARVEAEAASIAMPGCTEWCGNVSIPYPFGIGGNCSYPDFSITCNATGSDGPKPYLDVAGWEVLEIDVETALFRVATPVMASNCPNKANASLTVPFYELPFHLPANYNQLVATGCDNVAKLTYEMDSTTVSYDAACLSYCSQTDRWDNRTCQGINCCKTDLGDVYFSKVTTESLSSIQGGDGGQGCKTAAIVEKEWFDNNLTYPFQLQTMDRVPTVAAWSRGSNCTKIPLAFMPVNRSASMCGSHSVCLNDNCVCTPGYRGNAYIQDGCQDIDECADSSLNSCEKICTNTPGSYVCSCPAGFKLVDGNRCQPVTDIVVRRSYNAVIDSAIVIGALLLVTGSWMLVKVTRRRMEAKRKENNFKRNGGLLLESASGDESRAGKTKIFTSKELKKATDHYSEARILGRGGQGTVYKGMLPDGRIVAVKKSRVEGEAEVRQFVNEVALLSQINHRHVVRLHGCCLETEVPLLVYEFIPNGTLFQYIQEPNDDFPLVWDVRLRIASEIAGALSYLHSAASVPIYHRDIKSMNILLDDKYRAKVADFGTSRTISIDQTHLTTKVTGTFGYLDPEYFRSGQFTDKSDVYSFGVVLVELLTGQRPITSDLAAGGQGLAAHFVHVMEQDRLMDIIDDRLRGEGRRDEMVRFANVARRCLRLTGRKRPAMKEVAAEMDRIAKGTTAGTLDESPDTDQENDEIAHPFKTSAFTTESFVGSTLSPSPSSSSSSSDANPFIRTHP